MLDTFINEYLEFLNTSPTPFHATVNCIKLLTNSNFTRVTEIPNKPGKFYIKFNKTLLVAFIIPNTPKLLKIVATHNDSPVLKIKTNGINNIISLKPYGGGLWHTWFDRNLGIAGLVVDKTLKSHLINVCKPVVYIPHLAIHLDINRIYDGGFAYNKEKHLKGISGYQHINEIVKDGSELFKENDTNDILSHDLMLYDMEKATLGGNMDQYIFSARQDNLLSTFCAIKAIDQGYCEDSINMVSVFDAEEIGSETVSGAQSHLFVELCNNLAVKYNLVKKDSLIISCDVAHALNVNYMENYEHCNTPLLGKGMVIKYSNRYATNAYTSAIIKKIACKYQEFSPRNDCVGGGTIGPMLVCRTGIQGVDIGAPLLGMHSIKEVAHVDDVVDNLHLFTEFFKLDLK